MAEAPEHGALQFRISIRSPYCGIVLLHCKGADSAHAAKTTRKHENAMRHHLPSRNCCFFSYRDSLPPWQLYANFPSALLYYHSEQMLQLLQNAEVTKPINPAQQPGWAASSCDGEGLTSIPLLHQTPTTDRDQKPTSRNTHRCHHGWTQCHSSIWPQTERNQLYNLGPNMGGLTC